MAFEYDIFISLASGSNKNGWEKNLTIFLSTLLKRLLGRDITLGMSDEFNTDEQRFDAIKKSETYVLIITEAYLQSAELQKEIQLIEECLQGSFNRVFKVLKAEIPTEKQPKFIADLISYDFFEKTEDQDDVQFYYESMVFEVERHYWTKITDLAFDIYKVIDDEITSKEKLAVFVAETTNDQGKKRESIIRELKRLGYYVYPDKVLSTNSEILKKEIYKYLQKSFLSIHLIGNIYGESLENTDLSVVDFQNRISSEYFEMLQLSSEDTEHRNFSRLVWLDPDLKISNEKQKLFVEKLKRDGDLLKGASLIQTPLEHFKTIVISEIKNKISIPLHSFSKINQGVKVYLVHESSSFDKLSSISAHLIINGFEILHSPTLSEERNLLKKHRQNLIDCDAVLIFFDSNDLFWLNSKISDLKKAPGYGRKRPFAAKAVLLDCETVLSPDYFANKDFIVLKKSNEYSSYDLDKFLEKIQMTYV